MEFLLAAADDARTGLEKSLKKRWERSPGNQGPLGAIPTDDMQEVVQELARVRRAVVDAGDPKASEMWMPREPILAILQTELSRVLNATPGVLVDDPDGITSRRIEADRGERKPNRERAFGRFEITRPKLFGDPRWVWAGVVIAWHKFKNKAPFAGLPADATPIADNARVVLVGDWGSGLPRARAVASHIRDFLDDGVTDGRDQHVIHLGDVYYTGGREEYLNYFLEPWPVRPGESIGSYTLCGNHDMYQGGHEYYGTALADERFSRQAGRSVFALRNSHWQFLGLDTAYEDHQLSHGQADWVTEQCRSAPDRGTVLLSHHQLFSAYEDVGAKLRSQLAEPLAAGSIDAWFWGHEHRCLAYDSQHGVRFASCLGHGGVPEYLISQDPPPYPPGLRYDYRLKHGTSIEPWNTFGFAVLELDGPSMTVRYIDETGNEHHREALNA